MVSDACFDQDKIEPFQKGFFKLSCEQQKEFFYALMQNELMTSLLKKNLIPENITEINFTLGDSEFRNNEVNDKMIGLFLKNLDRFNELEKLHLDLRGLGFYGPAANDSLPNVSKMNLKKSASWSFSNLRPTTIKIGTCMYYYWDRGSPLTNVAIKLETLIKSAKEASRSFEYKLVFMNLTIHNNNKNIDIFEDNSVFENQTTSFSSNLLAFLEQTPTRIGP